VKEVIMKIVSELGVINTEKAKFEYSLDAWNGNNYQYFGVGLHATLFLSPSGQWYILHTSQWEGSRSYIEFVSEEQAYKLLIDSDIRDEDYKNEFSTEFIANQEEKEL